MRRSAMTLQMGAIMGLCYDAAMSSGLPWLRIAAARRVCGRPPFDEVCNVIKEVGAPKAQPTYLE